MPQLDILSYFASAIFLIDLFKIIIFNAYLLPTKNCRDLILLEELQSVVKVKIIPYEYI